MRLTQAVTERLRRRNKFYFIGYVLHNVHTCTMYLYNKNIEPRLLFGSKSTRVHTHECMGKVPGNPVLYADMGNHLIIENSLPSSSFSLPTPPFPLVLIVLNTQFPILFNVLSSFSIQ